MSLVTIIIPTFDRPAVLTAAGEACLAQTHADVEVIVIDDRSPGEDTRAAMDRLAADERVVCVHNERNLGFIRNWNIGLERARGAYVKVMGDDDMLDPDCLEVSLARLR